MTRLQEFCVITGILVLGTYACLSIAENAIARQDRVQQENVQ